MKKILVTAILLLLIYAGACSQTSVLQQPFRVVVVSPNYPNIYPRYKTLQAVYTAIKDSASISTGKYFIVNVTTNYNNITDWTGTYKDSLINRDPYIKLVAFGQSVNDSILSITTQEFTLVAGLLGLNPLIAGNGLSFLTHELLINPPKNPIGISADTLFFKYDTYSFKLTGGSLALNYAVNNGMRTDSVGVRAWKPLFTRNDTTFIKLSYYFTGWDDSLGLDYNNNHFVATYGSSPAFSIRLGGGMTSEATGIMVNVDSQRVVLSGSQITLPSTLAGTGLSWAGDSLNLILGDGLITGGKVLSVNALPQHFDFGSGYLALVVDSGLVADVFPTPRAPKVSLDNQTLVFNTSSQLKINDAVAGDGLYWNNFTLAIATNDFAHIENDTLKVRTSTILSFWGDSLTSLLSYCAPYDSTGYPVMASGMIKRIVSTYQLSSGNDTIIVDNGNNHAVSKVNKVRLVWTNGSSRWSISIWDMTTKAWTNAINISATRFANKKWRVNVEMWLEAL